MNERWVTRSISHTIEHKVVGESNGMLHTRCGQRIRVRLAMTVTESRGDNYRCSACAYGDMLSENTRQTVTAHAPA